MDPLGYALESFDAIGGLRSEDHQGHPVSTYGSLVGTDQDGDFDDARGLMIRIANSSTGPYCATQQLMSFAQRRTLNDDDQCSLDKAEAAFINSNYDFNALLRAIVTSDTFLYRDSTGAN